MANKEDYKKLIPELDPQRMPAHVGIIMDGNGRWAKQHRRPRLMGHRAGVKSTHAAVEVAAELNLQYLTLYAFSTENWSRPKSEVDGLMSILRESLIQEVRELKRQNVYLRIIGSPNSVDPAFWNELQESAATTHDNNGLNLNIAFNYGARLEVIEGIQKLMLEARTDPSVVETLTPEKFNAYLYTAGIPDPDLIIRTSGEFRISNFLLWQAAYSEFYVTPLYWPDFGKEQFIRALLDYQGRNRRFGGV